jgi:hypothetical protein
MSPEMENLLQKVAEVVRAEWGPDVDGVEYAAMVRIERWFHFIDDPLGDPDEPGAVNSRRASDLVFVVPELLWEVQLPCGCDPQGFLRPLYLVITHLNDGHQDTWDRDRIATWIDEVTS